MSALEIIGKPLERQLRGLNVALRAGSAERARRHARDAVSLVNEVTDLDLVADDLLLVLAEGAKAGRSGGEVLEALLERGVRRRLEESGALVRGDDGEHHATRDGDDLRDEVRGLLGAGVSPIDDDPRWGDLLG